MSLKGVESSSDYNIANWGAGYFQYNRLGQIEVINPLDGSTVSLQSIIHYANQSGLSCPLLIRFSDILVDRVKTIYQGFEEAIVEHDYQGGYQLVYPIKVNQEYVVVKSLLNVPNSPIGLEAGSRPELLAVLGVMGDASATIICNGYKDSAYVRLALIAQAMGHKVFLVIEKYSELALILNEASQLNLKPCLGVRIRLVTKGAGKWENTGGAKSKFGLNSEQVLALVEELKQQGMLDCLSLMHCHLGSQIANISDIRHCMQEVTQYYIALRQLHVPIATLDVGGGLAVDYEGTCSSTDCSMNYSIKEYASNILMTLIPACRAASVPEPNLISESGRALTAHHAVLVTNITDVERPRPNQDILPEDIQACHLIPEILDTLEILPSHLPLETYNYATASLEQAHSMFKHGLINLKQKAIVEAIFIEICLRLQEKLRSESSNQVELLQEINERVATKVYCNLSFFQSIPDSWAIKQIFPIAPLTQLLDKPSMQSILYDLTCDSDGTVKSYTGESHLLSTIMLPAYDEKNPYFLGFFLVGAYQEILGNLHNLFGDNSSLGVKLQGNGVFEIYDMAAGDTIEQVLTSAHFNMKHMVLSFEKQLKKANLPFDISRSYLNEILGHLSKPTYLEFGPHD